MPRGYRKDGSKLGFQKGKKHSLEHRKKIGDAQRGKIRLERRGEYAPNWSGGFQIRKDGYKAIRLHRKKFLEHRLVMEKLLGRKLKRREVIHHWNEKRMDNRSENLQLFRGTGAHLRLHAFAKRHNIPIQMLKFDQSWLFDPV